MNNIIIKFKAFIVATCKGGVMSWVKDKDFETYWEFKPTNINLGVSVYGKTGPTYIVKRCIARPAKWEAKMFLGNCGWRISDDLFDTKEQAQEWCERHSFENFKH